MEWVHSNMTGNRFFLYLNTKHETCLLPKMSHMYFQSSLTNCSYSYTNINVTVHIKSAINVHTVVANINVTVHINKHQQFIITSNKRPTYSSMCIVVVHSVVHLSSSVPSSSMILPLFPFPIYSILTIERQMQWLMMVFDLCINVSFDIQHIIEIQIRILMLYEWR